MWISWPHVHVQESCAGRKCKVIQWQGFPHFRQQWGEKAHIPNEDRPEMRRLKSRICFSAQRAKLLYLRNLIRNYFYASALEMFTYKMYFLNSWYCHFFFLYMTTSLSSLEAAQDFGFANFIVAMKTFWRLMLLKRASSHLHISVLRYMVTKYFLQTNFLYPWKTVSPW